jgi:hypothetical protein
LHSEDEHVSLYTSGLIGVTPIKLKTPMSLDELAGQAKEMAYPMAIGQPSDGWGSSGDDDALVGFPVISRITVGPPELLEERDLLPRRLRLRYYWDRLDKRMLRTIGDSASWDRLHTRQAVDVIIFDDETDSGRSVLLSSRDHRYLSSAPFPALRALGGDKATLETQVIAEGLDPDLFTWLLWRLQGKPDLGNDVVLESIREINSKDRQLRGARFTDDATIERIEMAALIAMGKMRFGPAKLAFGVPDLKAVFELELHPDGGFSVYRNSYYEDLVLPADLYGHQLVEDMWSVVLPRVRDAYNRDSEWRNTGRDNLKDLAVRAIRAILPDE